MWKLLMLRLYCRTLGRSEFFSLLLRRVLVRLLIKGQKEKYTASSRFFDPRELS
ncbi:MAG: hypothetical protein V1913_12775 [Fibrobacterota bacterium]